MIEPASIQETWLSLLRGKNFDGDACLEGLVKQTADRLDAQEARIAELTEAYQQIEKGLGLAANENAAANKFIAELEKALREIVKHKPFAQAQAWEQKEIARKILGDS